MNRSAMTRILCDAFHRGAALSRFTKIITLGIVATLVTVVLAAAAPPIEDKDRPAPIDFGDGPGKPPIPKPLHKLGFVPKHPPIAPLNATPAAKARKAPNAAAASTSGGGFFGPAFDWPIIPLHMALLPDPHMRVLNFGTDQTGAQGAQMIYDVWDPTIGNVPNAHTILSNTTGTDIFCSGVSLLDGSGNVLITGGDLTVNGVRNNSQNHVELFSPVQNTLTSTQPMNFARWYGSITTLPNGEKLLLGGITIPGPGEPTPEVRSATLGWRTLPGISIDPNQWYYPRGFVGADAAVYLVQDIGNILRLTTDGVNGTMQDTGRHPVADGDPHYPSLMFTNANGNPFSVLTVRTASVVNAVDISTSLPAVIPVSSPTYDRQWGNLTLLANGQILYSGGSGAENQLTNVAYQTELFDPATRTWTLDATATKPRQPHN